MNQYIKKLLFSIFAITTITFNLNSMGERPTDDFCKLPQAPVTPRPTKRPRIIPQSAQKIVMPAENICRQIIDDLDKEILQKVTDKLYALYYKIPTAFLFPKWQCSEAEKEKFYKNMNLAIFYTIFLCLGQSTQDIEQYPDLQNPNIIIDNNSVLLTLGKYKIIFSINGRDKSLRIQSSDDPEIPTIASYTTNNFIKQILLRLLDKNFTDTDFLANKLTIILNKIPLNIHEKKEQFYHTIIYVISIFMGSNISLAEAYSGEGRADLVLQTDDSNCVIEFKLNSRPKVALEQLEKTNYARFFLREPVKALGIDIQSRTKNKKISAVTVSCIQKTIFFTPPQLQQISSNEYKVSF